MLSSGRAENTASPREDDVLASQVSEKGETLQLQQTARLVIIILTASLWRPVFYFSLDKDGDLDFKFR